MSISAAGGATAVTPYAASGSASPSPALPSAKPDQVSEFLSWARMTPAQRMRANVLASMGLSENDLAGMSAKDRTAVEKKIADKIKQLVEQSTEKKTGVLADLKV